MMLGDRPIRIIYVLWRTRQGEVPPDQRVEIPRQVKDEDVHLYLEMMYERALVDWRVTPWPI